MTALLTVEYGTYESYIETYLCKNLLENALASQFRKENVIPCT